MKEKIISLIKSLGLPLEDIAVYGSGPICVRGWREFNDVDMIARPEIFQRVKQLEGVVIGEAMRGGEEAKFERDGIEFEFFNHWGPGEWDVNELIDTADDFEGVKFVNLENVLKWKRLLGRDKDQSDVELIMKKMDE